MLVVLVATVFVSGCFRCVTVLLLVAIVHGIVSVNSWNRTRVWYILILTSVGYIASARLYRSGKLSSALKHRAACERAMFEFRAQDPPVVCVCVCVWKVECSGRCFMFRNVITIANGSENACLVFVNYGQCGVWRVVKWMYVILCLFLWWYTMSVDSDAFCRLFFVLVLVVFSVVVVVWILAICVSSYLVYVSLSTCCTIVANEGFCGRSLWAGLRSLIVRSYPIWTAYTNWFVGCC